MFNFKSFILGLTIGMILAYTIANRFKKRYFLLPIKVKGQFIEYHVPDDLVCLNCIKSDKQGHIYLEYRNK